MRNEDLHYLTISELEPMIRDRKLSPVELVRACLDRIHALDGRFHAFITVMEESALAEARAAEEAVVAGSHTGPLHGIPVGLKDLYYTKGVATTAGARFLADFVPEEDAPSVANLRAAGGIILGKLNLHQFAFGAIGTNPQYGTPANPWDTERIPGGSSSGSGVALMAGMLPAATGSDTGGSIRIPSAICGVVGIKPTYGRVSLRGIIPLSGSLDHAGPMARSVEDCAILLEAMAGHDPKDPRSVDLPVPSYRNSLRQSVKGLRAGVPRGEFFGALQPAVRDAVEKAIATLEELGVSVEEVEVPSMDEAVTVSLGLLGPEAAAYHKRWMDERPGDYDPQVLRRLQAGSSVSVEEYEKAKQGKADFTRRYQDVMKDLDLLLAPTEPVTAPKIGESSMVIDGVKEATQNLMVHLNRPFNITGMPAITVPCGFDEDGLPVGLQIAGKPFDEATVLRTAYAYEQATPWHTRRPAL